MSPINQDPKIIEGNYLNFLVITPSRFKSSRCIVMLPLPLEQGEQEQPDPVAHKRDFQEYPVSGFLTSEFQNVAWRLSSTEW